MCILRISGWGILLFLAVSSAKRVQLEGEAPTTTDEADADDEAMSLQELIIGDEGAQGLDMRELLSRGLVLDPALHSHQDPAASAQQRSHGPLPRRHTAAARGHPTVQHLFELVPGEDRHRPRVP